MPFSLVDRGVRWEGPAIKFEIVSTSKNLGSLLVVSV